MSKKDQRIYWPSLLHREDPLRNPKLLWRLGSRFVVPAVGILSRFWTNFMNRSVIHNHQVLLETLANHYKNKTKRCLITISNHSSTLDDPLMWGALVPFKWHLNSHRLRWSAAAQEICFSKAWHSTFFSLGKTYPIVRGKGIYQPGMDFALELLKGGAWIHFFPQGKVVVRSELEKKLPEKVEETPACDQSKKTYELKWGVARLILERVLNEDSVVDVLPIYHLGMEDVVPLIPPYLPRIGKTVTFYVREKPLQFDKAFFESLDDFFLSKSSSAKRIRLMKIIEDEMNLLKLKCLNSQKQLQNLIS